MQVLEKLNQAPKADLPKGYFPLVEIVLNGNFAFEKLIDILHEHYKVPYKLTKAEIEYTGKVNFGKLEIKLEGTAVQNSKIFQFFQQNKIENSVIGYG